MSMNLLFVIDPISGLDVRGDTGLSLMRTAHERGHSVVACRTLDLWALGDVPMARARPVEVRAVPGDHYRWLGEAREVDLRGLDAVFMRRDPPFDMDYVYATYLLSLAAPHTRVINDPAGLRNCNEKAYALRFPHLIPPSLVTKDIGRLRAFVRKHGQAVIKPLDGKGGQGIVLLGARDPSLNSILEILTWRERRFVMLQRYVQEAREGDRRLLLVDGRPVGPVLLRVPAEDDLRGNMCAGATVRVVEPTDRDLEICEAIAPTLRADGHAFAGIDILGRWLTEINVTSPTGNEEIRALAGVDVSAHLVEWLESAG